MRCQARAAMWLWGQARDKERWGEAKDGWAPWFSGRVPASASCPRRGPAATCCPGLACYVMRKYCGNNVNCVT